MAWPDPKCKANHRTLYIYDPIEHTPRCRILFISTNRQIVEHPKDAEINAEMVDEFRKSGLI